MATPFGHSLASYAVYRFYSVSGSDQSRHLMLLTIFMANFPDLDFLPGVLVGRPALYHQGITHSIGFGFLVSLTAAGVYRLTAGGSFRPVFVVSLFSYLTHLVIDFFGPDGRPPYGQPLLWPITWEYFISPVQIFLGAGHVGSTNASNKELLEGILSIHNLKAIAVEVLLMSPFVLVIKGVRRLSLKSVTRQIDLLDT